MLTQSDYIGIGVIAQHCDPAKLIVAENEALKYDLSQLYCNSWLDILEIWNEVIDYQADLAACTADPDCSTPPVEPTNYALKLNLINGGEYTNCNAKTRSHEGVKAVALKYAYSRYTIINGFNDTPSGLVQKTNDFSIPKPLKELEMFADKYRNMGKIDFEGTLGFLCANKETFTFFESGDCGHVCGCKCDDGCDGTKARGYGLRSSNISKRI